ncbi:MAG: AEC family transporter [Clostridia bacterium]|nr:AEC family transporter [Clostridia bacterium]
MTIGQIFLFSFNAVMPIVLLILLGYLLKRIKLFNDYFVSTANKFVFNVALPVLLFFNVYNIRDFSEIEWSTVVFAVTVILLLFAAGLIYCMFFVKDSRQKGVVWQSFFRSNFAIIGLPLAEAIGGTQGVVTASILSAFSIPLFNALAVVALSVFTGDKNRISVKDILIKVVKNPLIRGVFLGFVVLGIRHFIPCDESGTAVFTVKNNLPFIYEFIEMLAGIASPLALVVLGGQFRFDAVKSLKKQISAGVTVRIIFAPVTGILLAVAASSCFSYFDFAPAHYASFVALFGSPVAVSSAIMADQMGNDGQLANQILVWTSIFSVLTVFALVTVLKYLSLI